MKAFLDTSSLIKLYHQEEGTDHVMKALSSDIREIFLSELAILEFRSAIWKKIREKEIQERAAIEVIKCFQNDVDNFQWTLDSLQLAAALTMKDKKCVFLTSDKLLLTLFKDELLNVL